jgi:hypothetical protein
VGNGNGNGNEQCAIEHHIACSQRSGYLLLARKFESKEYPEKHGFNLVVGAYMPSHEQACGLIARFERALKIELRDPQSPLVSELGDVEDIFRKWAKAGAGGVVNSLKRKYSHV